MSELDKFTKLIHDKVECLIVPHPGRIEVTLTKNINGSWDRIVMNLTPKEATELADAFAKNSVIAEILAT